jgi:Ca2+-binding RTX toxin-like protein
MVKGREFQIEGLVEADDYGARIGNMSTDVAQVDFTLGEKGRIVTAGTGVESYGAGHVLKIDGLIDAGIDGVSVHGDQKVTITGEITAHNGVNMFVLDGKSAVVTNLGDISGTNYSIFGTAIEDKVINNGNLTGNVNLGSNADTFIHKGGTIEGVVLGGTGDDVYVARAEGLKVVEGYDEGTDTVRSTVSYELQSNVEKLYLLGKGNIDGTGTGGNNELYGNAGKNHLIAADGFDMLNGGKGNDILEGGVGSDEFYFQKGTGKDVIADYEAGFDDLHFYYLDGATNFADMIEDHAVQKNGDVVITFGKDSIVLKDHAIADLQEADFHFYS